MKDEVRLIGGKYVLIKLIEHKFLSPLEARELINKELAIDTIGHFSKLG